MLNLSVGRALLLSKSCDAGRALTLNQLHDDERLPVVLLEPIERGDVRVIDLGEETGLSLESFQSLFVS